VLGLDEQATLGEFAPHWIYPGPAHIERHLLPYRLSVDVVRLKQLKTHRPFTGLPRSTPTGGSASASRARAGDGLEG